MKKKILTFIGIISILCGLILIIYTLICEREKDYVLTIGLAFNCIGSFISIYLNKIKKEDKEKTK